MYVLVSRVTDPANFALCGLPPKDLVEAVAAALREEGYDIDEVFERACSTCNEHEYEPCRRGALSDRFMRRYRVERTMPVQHRSLAETLNPQPLACFVTRRLLSWIDRCDEATQRGEPRPIFVSEDGSAIFPPESAGDDHQWWLTGVKRKQETDNEAGKKGDEDGPPESDLDETEVEDERPADALTTDSDTDPEHFNDVGQLSQPQAVTLPLVRPTPCRRAAGELVEWARK